MKAQEMYEKWAKERKAAGFDVNPQGWKGLTEAAKNVWRKRAMEESK